MLTVLLGGHFNISDLSPIIQTRSDMDTFLECLDSVGMSKKPHLIIKGAESLNGTYLKMENETYTFCHPSLYDAIACIMAENFPHVVLQYCTMKFIQDFLRLHSKGTSSTYVTLDDYQCTVKIQRVHSNMFVWRFVNELKQCNFSQTLQHDVLRQTTFVNELIKKLEEEIFHKTDKTHGQTFLFWAAHLSTADLVKTSLQRGTFDEHEYLEALFGCAISGNIQSMNIIIDKADSMSIKDLVISASIADIFERETNAKQPTESVSDVSLHKNPFLDAKDDRILHVACIHAHCDVVNKLLKLGCDVDIRGDRGRTPLMYASRGGHDKVADILLKAHANIHIKDDEGACALHFAARGGHINVAKTFIENGVSINEKGEHDRTPLLYACRYGCAKFVEFCLENGGDPKIKCIHDSCLHLACKSGNLDTVKIILKRGLDINEPGHFLRTPIMYACLHGKMEIAKYLKSSGAVLNTLDTKKENIMHMAVLSGNVQLLEDLRSCPKTKHLISTLRGSSVFDRASARGHYDMIKYFIQSDERYISPPMCLISACYRGHTALIAMLVNVVDDINYRGYKGRTALMTACLGGQTETVRFLISKMANITLLDNFNDSCWKFACDSGNVNLVEYLLKQHGFTTKTPCQNGMTSVMIACRRNHQDLFQFLISQNEKAVHMKDSLGNSCLHHCCAGFHDNTFLLETLVAQHLDINCRDTSEKTPLMLAFQNGCSEIVQWLMKHDADLNVKDISGKSCLHYACRSNKVDNVKFLLISGFNVNCTDGKKNTPIMEACFLGNTVVVELLLQNNADVNAQNSYSETCVDVAIKKNHENVLTILGNHGVNAKF